MTTVFAVSYGSYSDYHIEAIFSTREKAEEYRRRYNLMYRPYRDTGEIEEYELNEELVLPQIYYVVDITGNEVAYPVIGEPQQTASIPRGSSRATWYRQYEYWRGEGVGDTAEQAVKGA